MKKGSLIWLKTTWIIQQKMKENILLRCNDSIYGVQISPMLPQDKKEFTVINDYMMMASTLHATAWPVLSSEAGTKCFASILPLLEENTHACHWAWHWHLCVLRSQRAHCFPDLSPSDISHAGKLLEFSTDFFCLFVCFKLETTYSVILMFSFCPYFSVLLW